MISYSHHSNIVMKKSKKSKKAKASEGEDGVDMISNLPDDLLQIILSHIPTTEEVVRTSILSRRWRNLWTSVPFIDIDYRRGWGPHKDFDINGFKEFVYWVLLNKPLDLDSFRLWCSNGYNMSTIRRWIHAAVTRKVKLLDLMFFPIDESEKIKLPPCLVTCGSLEVFKLFLVGCRLHLPRVTGFQALRVLELNDVSWRKADVVKYFLKSCPLLEDLSLIDCHAYELIISCPKLKKLRIQNRERFWDDKTEVFLYDRMSFDLQISCPKLVFLNLSGSLSYDFLFENLDSLEKAVIHIKEFFESEDPAFHIFDELSHVVSLSINLYCVGQIYNPRIDDPISLPNLKTLELTVDALHMLIPFLECLPDLESLHLIFVKDLDGWELDSWFLQEIDKISILTRHLKKVEFLEFDEEELKLVLARVLIELGNELEEMVFSWDDEARFHERSMETLNQVSKFHKASSSVKLSCVIKPSQAN